MTFEHVFNRQFVKALQQAGGEIFIVGGAVRDALMGIDPKDIDIIVTGLPIQQLITIIKPFGKTDLVGESFGVIKFVDSDGEDFDIALPRTDSPKKEFVVTQESILENPTVFKILYGGSINENNKV